MHVIRIKVLKKCMTHRRIFLVLEKTIGLKKFKRRNKIKCMMVEI